MIVRGSLDTDYLVDNFSQEKKLYVKCEDFRLGMESWYSLR